ncbi:MAG TPA: gluconate 2-dehydrogenase subunit 3 family protein [Longimicrobiales bacterium]|nr:gluconate 2-dehydrogenase subunit 3 family protein [Longimicrobiales bacterium]
MSDELSRRDALAIMAIAPLAAALGTTPDVIEGAMAAAQQAQAQQSPLAGQKPQPGVYKPRFFTAHEWRTVRVLSDLIIPRDARSGSATDAGVPEFMDFMMLDRDSMQLQMRGGLRWLDNRSHTHFSKRFVTLTKAQQKTVLDEIAYPDKAVPDVSHGVSFFNFFRDLTAAGFFSSRIGVKDIGYIGNEWRTWDGCPPAAMQRLGVSHDAMKKRIPFQRG